MTDYKSLSCPIFKDSTKYKMVDWVPRSSCLHKPHLSYSISVLQKFSNALCQVHWQAAIHGLWYLAGTTNYGFSFKAGIEWVGYSHANWAGDADTWWPASGYCLILGSGLSLGSPKTIFSLIFFYKSWISCLFGNMWNLMANTNPWPS